MKFAKTFALLAGGMALALTHSSSAIAKTDLLVYTAVEADELKKFKKLSKPTMPTLISNGSAIRQASSPQKLLAEKDNPKADIVWGVAATSLLLLSKYNYFQGYAPNGVEKLDKKYYDTKNNPPLWVGQRAWIASVCYNTVEAAKHNLPLPTSWADLTKGVYKGHVIMPNRILPEPVSSTCRAGFRCRARKRLEIHGFTSR